MQNKMNIIHFPNLKNKRNKEREEKYTFIRDEIESILNKYSKIYNDEWAVVLAAGRFSSMKLQQIEGSDNSIDFFKKCIETQAKKNINQ
ncbi:MAG: hypothetical protein CMP37_00710 [Rickettsiales bacterium]|jgi:hypothetical protein|nr:hypothetical protein [Rickettsiales bacterium]OUW72866.1 MAG: hypothetical protein CBD71_00750 [Rickettsiales bacterium TMED211]|tara:strand:+ start:351 stop:617 length:267 start_codon:yes stop_codon:yes gene_type:complete